MRLIRVRLLTVAALLLGCLAVARAYLQPLPGPRDWRPPVPVQTPRDEPKVFEREFVDPEEHVRMVHAPTICELPGGRLCAAWYGGTGELASDVAVYLSTKDQGEATWSQPRAIVTRQSAGSELGRYIGRIGNALVFADATGRLSLVYASITLGKWSGSALNIKTSDDQGRTWTSSERLTLNPFLNVAELVRNKPFSVTSSAVGIPVYNEFVSRFPEIVWLSASRGDVRWQKQRIAGGGGHFQPSIVWIDGRRLRAFLRDSTSAHSIKMIESVDGGHSWQNERPLGLPNPNAGIDALRLADGRLLLVFNDARTGRENLRLAVSSDAGETWRVVATLDEERGAEFSYPSMIQDRAGRIHVVYTWKRTHIRHVVFNASWLPPYEAR